MRVVNGENLKIADAGEVLTLDYDAALAAHGGESWFGVAVGFRMLQAAGEALSIEKLWDRNDLAVLSGHPGSGVCDAIEFVTRCVSHGRYRVDKEITVGCSRDMRFTWEVADGSSIAVLRLRDGFVPEELFDLLGRRGTSDERADDACRFTRLKRRLATQTWDESLERLFSLEVLDVEVAKHA